MKKTSKIISILLIVMMLLCVATTSFAAIEGVDTSPSDLKGQAVSGTEKINDLGNQIITILTTIGVVISVIILIVLGLKYMMGSAEEKAEYKKTMMPYIIGAACIFAASAIAGIIYGFLSNVS
jgi:type IV secretory pathway VirB2 component (pilin)